MATLSAACTAPSRASLPPESNSGRSTATTASVASKILTAKNTSETSVINGAIGAYVTVTKCANPVQANFKGAREMGASDALSRSIFDPASAT
eukprot:CAMPEP_0179837576 /NCGR_PEP_ID=MMETSP0982-20121206/97_1 /TAXON_ID=483367 /ORGANISM="non described non described, Strain CCMP 2436" /LENGTH=92 /DNA_ID=CAMNT_0021720651 /DNA_START=734 /DNA_END=1012 /DNA_ORIENTATION=+